MEIKYKFKWWVKLFDFLRHDIPRFIKNIYGFRNTILNHYDFEAYGTLLAMRDSLIICQKGMAKYKHVGDDKRQLKMLRAIELLNNACNDNYIELAEKEIGVKCKIGGYFDKKDKKDTLTDFDILNNKKIFELSNKLEESQWNDLFEILKGQNNHDFKYEQDKKTFVENHYAMEDAYEEWFDGSGIKSWWH